MAKLNLVINNRIEVKWEDENYKSMVQDTSNKNLLISVPVLNGVYLTLKTGEEIELVYYDDKANVFSFKCKVINRIVENDIPYYSITLPYDVIKIQRRNHVRVHTVQVIRHIEKYNEEPTIEECQKLYNCLLLDISGGGMRIKLKEKLEMNERIIAKIGNEKEELQVKGEIVRINRTEDKRYMYGVSFWDLDNKTREQIIGMVFKIMRKQGELK